MVSSQCRLVRRSSSTSEVSRKLNTSSSSSVVSRTVESEQFVVEQICGCVSVDWCPPSASVEAGLDTLYLWDVSSGSGSHRVPSLLKIALGRPDVWLSCTAGRSASENRLPLVCDASLALGPSCRIVRICSSRGSDMLIDDENVTKKMRTA